MITITRQLWCTFVLKSLTKCALFFSKTPKHYKSQRAWRRQKPKSLTRKTKQGDLHSFFHADSEGEVFDMRFSVRKKIFLTCGATYRPNFNFFQKVKSRNPKNGINTTDKIIFPKLRVLKYLKMTIFTIGQFLSNMPRKGPKIFFLES